MAVRKVNIPTKIAYAVGEIGPAIKNGGFEIFLLFYYTQVLQLSGTLAGLALFIALCVDAITDPLIGILSDNLKSRWGRRHPFMYASIIPFCLSFFLVFAPPGSLGEVGLFIWLVIFAVAVRASITLFAVPYYATGAELSDDYLERTSLVQYRTMGLAIGNIILIFVAFTYFFAASPEYENGQLNPAAYPTFAVAFSLIAFVAMLISVWGTHSEIPYLKKPAKQVSRKFTFQFAVSEFFGVLKSYAFRSIFIGMVFYFTMRGVMAVLGLHMGTYFWEFSPGELRNINLGLTFAMVATIPCVKLVHKYIDKKTVLLVGLAFSFTFISAPPALALMGLFPENGTNLLFYVFFSTYVVLGIAAGFLGVTQASMIADVSDDLELISARRQEGILFGYLNFAGKTASGFGHALAGVCLDFIAFPTDAAPGDVPASTLAELGLLYGPGIGVVGLISFYFFSKYNISRKRHAEIQVELGRH